MLIINVFLSSKSSY